MSYDFITQEHYRLLTNEEAKFIFDQAEKHLKDQIETGAQINTKATTLLTVISGLMIALIGFAITRWTANSKADLLVWSTLLGSLYLYFIVWTLLKALQPKLYVPVGLHPKDMFTDDAINERNKDYRLKAFYINEIKECQMRIDRNKDTNEDRWALVIKALKLISYAPAIFIVLYILSLCFTSSPTAVHSHL